MRRDRTKYYPVFASLDNAEPWSFNTLNVYEVDGELYWATDSGCSCPTPFEWVHSLADLNRLTLENFDTFKSTARHYANDMVEGMQFLDKVKTRLKELSNA